MPTSVTKQMRTETSHLLPGHSGRCKNLHGHSYLWEVSLIAGQLMLNGMVEDFGDLKKHMTEVIDPFDHTLVLYDGDAMTKPLVEVLEAGEVCRIMIVPWYPTAENFCYHVWLQLKKHYPLLKINVKCWETATSYAEYAEP